MSVLQIKTPEVFEPLLEDARYKGAFGGRGSGKSHHFAEALVERCLLKETRAVCIREVQKSLEQSILTLILLIGISEKLSIIQSWLHIFIHNLQISFRVSCLFQHTLNPILVMVSKLDVVRMKFSSPPHKFQTLISSHQIPHPI